MKVSELEIGEVYEIQYRDSIPAPYKAKVSKPGRGIGKLVKIDHKPGWHKFSLSGNRRTVYAASKGIIGPATGSSLFLSEEIVPKAEISEEVKKLRKIGLDDSLRKQEVEALIVFLNGLGVKAHHDEDYTEITLKYLDIATFKAILANVYQQALIID